MSGGYPQVSAASVFAADGKLLVTSRAYLAPDMSVATREDFGGQRNNHKLEEVSRVMLGRVAGEQVFNTTVARRTPKGKFNGIVSIALRPAYFNAFYRELLSDSPTVTLGLSRSDGEVLAWYPPRPPDRMTLAPDSPSREAYRESRRACLGTRPAGEDRRVPADRRLSGVCVERLSDRNDLVRVVEASVRARAVDLRAVRRVVGRDLPVAAAARDRGSQCGFTGTVRSADRHADRSADRTLGTVGRIAFRTRCTPQTAMRCVPLKALHRRKP